MRYFDWLTDDANNPSIILFNSEIYDDCVASHLTYINQMIVNPIKKLYCQRGVYQITIILPPLFLRLPTNIGVTDKVELKIYKKQ